MHITANVISFFIYVNHCWKKASSGSIAVEPLTAYYEIKDLNLASAWKRKKIF